MMIYHALLNSCLAYNGGGGGDILPNMKQIHYGLVPSFLSMHVTKDVLCFEALYLKIMQNKI